MHTLKEVRESIKRGARNSATQQNVIEWINSKGKSRPRVPINKAIINMGIQKVGCYYSCRSSNHQEQY